MFSPPFRSRKVLDHARGQPCTLRFRVCNGDPATTVSCHITDRYKGMGIKASDSSICFGCDRCHAYIDQGHWLGDISEADMLRVVLRAMQETLVILIRDEVITFPHDKPKPFAERKTKERKPKELRTKVAPSRPLESGSNWPPKGSRKIPTKPFRAPSQ